MPRRGPGGRCNKSRHLKLCKKRPEPAPIDNSVPPGSDLETTVDELLARPRCATCADDQCGDQGKDLVACDDHEPAAMPECEGEACTIAPDPILDAPFSERPQGPASGDAPLTTTGLRQWLVDELMALTDRAEARGFRLAANISWGEELSANLTVCKEASRR